MIKSVPIVIFFMLQIVVMQAQMMFSELDFEAVDILNHKPTQTHFEIGYFLPKGYTMESHKVDNQSIYHIADSTLVTSLEYNNQVVEGYLKVSKKGQAAEFISLQLYDDLDLLGFVPCTSENLIIYKNRYRFGIYDIRSQSVSAPQLPGENKYEGEDAISSILGGFNFFDQDQYLFGHVQAYGIFCYDLSQPSHPKELLRYAISNNNEGLCFDNQGEYHVFLHPKGNGTWNILLGQSDTTSKQSVLKLYSKFNTLSYGAQNLVIRLKDSGESDVCLNRD